MQTTSCQIFYQEILSILSLFKLFIGYKLFIINILQKNIKNYKFLIK